MQESLFGDTPGIGDEMGAVETWCRDQRIDWIVGIDEAGRGPLAGPVYAAAVVVDTRTLDADWIGHLDDSKQLTEAEREEAFAMICREAPARAISSRAPATIDEINILEATREAMLEAVREVSEAFDDSASCLFVDGNVELATSRRQQALVSGDARSYAIAAASILAKVSRDREMDEYGDRWPAYNFASNKGYPTSDHRAVLDEQGPCPIHRRSFSGVDDS